MGALMATPEFDLRLIEEAVVEYTTTHPLFRNRKEISVQDVSVIKQNGFTIWARATVGLTPEKPNFRMSGTTVDLRNKEDVKFTSTCYKFKELHYRIEIFGEAPFEYVVEGHQYSDQLGKPCCGGCYVVCSEVAKKEMQDQIDAEILKQHEIKRLRTEPNVVKWHGEGFVKEKNTWKPHTNQNQIYSAVTRNIYETEQIEENVNMNREPLL